MKKWWLPRSASQWIVLVTQLPLYLICGLFVGWFAPMGKPLLIMGIPAFWFWCFFVCFISFVGIIIAVSLDRKTVQYDTSKSQMNAKLDV